MMRPPARADATRFCFWRGSRNARAVAAYRMHSLTPSVAEANRRGPCPVSFLFYTGRGHDGRRTRDAPKQHRRSLR
jgi:hypothetical protein